MSQLIDRLLVSRGPAMITHRGGFFFTREDLVVDLSKETKEIPSAAFGPLTEINLGVKATATFRPIGEFEHIEVCWPYATTPIGRSILGDQDYPVLIQPLDTTQRQVTFHAGGVNKMPDLTFTAEDTLIGEMGLLMVGKNATPVDDPNRLFTLANNGLAGNLPYDPEKLLIQAYQNRWLSGGTFTLTFGADTTPAIPYNATANAVGVALNALASVTAAGGLTVAGSVDDGWTVTWSTNGDKGAITGAVTGMPGGTSVRVNTTQGTGGSAEVVVLRLFPWHAFQAREGVKVAFALQVSEDGSDAIGTYDAVFNGLSVTVSAEPQGLDIETIMAAAAVQGPNSVRGRKLSSGAHNLDVFADGVFFRLYGAGLKKSGMVYSSSKQRIPELQWTASRTLGAGGALNPLFYIGAAAPA